MIESKNGKTMLSGSVATLLSELASIAQAMKEAIGDDADELIPMAVAMGMSGLFKGKEITEEEFYQEMA